MPKFNRRLTAAFILYIFFCLLRAGSARAQGVEEIESVPVEAVAEELLIIEETEETRFELDPDIPVVVELFSSQACVFCPQADRLFADLIRQPSIIGLACHIDYFDVREGSLSKPFCTERQSWYVETLETGPNYTPQMVLQGSIDVVGYRMEDVVTGLKEAAQRGAVRLAISRVEGEESGYRVTLPPELELPAAQDVWLALFDPPHELTIAGGRNRGQKMTYFNIVSEARALEPLEGESSVVEVTSAGRHAGFAILVQEPATGRMLAAGQYMFLKEAGSE